MKYMVVIVYPSKKLVVGELNKGKITVDDNECDIVNLSIPTGKEHKEYLWALMELYMIKSKIGE